MPLFPHPTPWSTASTYQHAEYIKHTEHRKTKINSYISDSYMCFLRDIAQLDYLNSAHIMRLSDVYSLFTCLEMRDIRV